MEFLELLVLQIVVKKEAPYPLRPQGLGWGGGVSISLESWGGELGGWGGGGNYKPNRLGWGVSISRIGWGQGFLQVN